jgi:hypothetical protein
MAMKGWTIGEKEKHYVEIDYPASGVLSPVLGYRNIIVRVDGKEVLRKSGGHFHRPTLSLQIGERKKLNVEIKWFGRWLSTEPMCYVNGIFQNVQVSKGLSAWDMNLIWVILFVLLLFLIWFAAGMPTKL